MQIKKIVLRVDVRLVCNPGSDPTGSLQGQLNSGITTYDRGTGEETDVINTGEQTIPFKNAGDIAGAGEPLLEVVKKVVLGSGECVNAVDEITVSAGTTVKYCYFVSNYGTNDLYDVVLVDDNGTPDQI